MQKYRSIFLVILTALIIAACAPVLHGPQSQIALGTICHINLYEKGTQANYDRVFARITELENILSANLENSDLDRVNQNAGIEPVKVRPELIFVLERALEYAEKSRGLFDPSIGPLIKLWGINTDNVRVPGEDEIRQTLELIDYHQIEINREEGTVFLTRPGMSLDLGAIAKGYIADEVVLLLGSMGIERCIIDLGGDIFAMGERAGGNRAAPEGSYWRVGIQDPRGSQGEYLGILSVANYSVVSSGVYERFFEADGVNYHHLFSPETGFPADSGLLSVTVISERAIDADALSTAAFVMGWDRGSELIASIPGAGGIFVFEDHSIRITQGIEGIFTLTNSGYRLIH